MTVPPWVRALLSLLVLLSLAAGAAGWRATVRARAADRELGQVKEQLSAAVAAYKRALHDADLAMAEGAALRAKLQALEDRLARLEEEAAEAAELRRRVEYLLAELAKRDRELLRLREGGVE